MSTRRSTNQVLRLVSRYRWILLAAVVVLVVATVIIVPRFRERRVIPPQPQLAAKASEAPDATKAATPPKVSGLPSGYDYVASNQTLALYVDRATSHVIVADLRSGQLWA